MTTIYRVTCNSDLTEGKGGERLLGYFDSFDSANSWVKENGGPEGKFSVMGTYSTDETHYRGPYKPFYGCYIREIEVKHYEPGDAGRIRVLEIEEEIKKLQAEKARLTA